MQTNFPPLKRQKHGNDLVRNCLYCDAQQHDGTCPHSTLTNGQQLSLEYQQLQAAAEDPSFDMNDIERRLRKLETQLALRLKREGNIEKDHHQQLSDSSNNNDSSSTSVHHQHQEHQRNDPAISLTSTGISITTNLTESHHFFKHIVSGINPTFVREKAAQVYSRCVDLAGPTCGNPNNTEGISNLAMDKEGPEEQVWFDMVLATRYAKCFRIYQMVENNRLAEWVSPAYINNLTGQVKLEHSLLSKSVRAFVYSHEKLSSHDAIPGGGVDPALGRQRPNVNLNRDVFFFQQAEELLELCYTTSSRNTIRALLHMYMYQVMTPGGYTKAVHYSDLALRMAQSLKLNKEKGMLVNDQLREDDRRLWWSTVWIHLWSCVALQRPLMVDASEIMVPGSRSPNKRQNESSQVGYCVDLCVHCVKLLLLSRSIRQRLESKTTEAILLRELKDMEHQLDAWSLALPEPLQPRFWNSNNNGNNDSTPSNGLLDHLDDTGHHDHDHALPAQAFAMEIGLMLQGLWTLTKTQLYECYGTNDGSVLDLLVTRNRLQVAMDYVNHLAQAINRIRPCVNQTVLTLTGSSLSTLLTMVTYPHNSEVVEHAARHLVGLKTLLQAYPFTDDSSAHKWIFDIDQTLVQHGPRVTQQQQPGSTLDRSRNTNGSITTINETISTQLQEFHHHLHQYPPDLNQSTIKADNSNNNNIHPLNIGPTLFTTPTSSSAAILDGRELQQYQVYGSTALGKTAVLDGIDLYRLHPGGMQQTQLENLSPSQYMQSSSSSGVPAAAPSSSYIHPYRSTNIPISTFQGSQTHSRTLPPPSSSDNSHYGFYQQQQQHQLQWSMSREGDHHSSGKQPSESSPDHPSPPLPPRLDPDHHPFLPYPSTDQHDRRPYG